MLKTVVLSLALIAPIAHAKPVAVAQGEGHAMVLFDDKGTCPEGTRIVEFHSRAGRVVGCWFAAHGFIWSFFEDGDAGALPVAVFKFAHT